MEEKYSKEEVKSLRTGIIAMLTILVAVFLTISHNASIKGKKVGSAYKIYANFGHTDGLNIGDVVRMSGVNIGRVVAATLDENFTSKLTMEIDSKYKIPDDSSASIVSYGLIGGKYIEIDVGGSEDYIHSGGQISYTQDAMILEDLLDRIISIGKAKRTTKVEPEKTEENTEEKVENIKDSTENKVENITENTADKVEENTAQIADENVESTVEIADENVENMVENTEENKEMNDE